MLERLLNRYWYSRRSAYKPLGPVFISYRQSDGFVAAAELAWSLRSSGVPVWVDQTELPPGEIKRRLREALNSGLSGCVVIVSPEVSRSKIVRELEVPGLLTLRQASEFSFAVANLVQKDDGSIDHKAPDRLLRQGGKSFGNTKQYPLISEDDRFSLARSLALERARSFSRSSESTLTVDIASRTIPTTDSKAAHLTIRTEPPSAGQRRPPTVAWQRLKHSLGFLPDAVEVSGCDSIVVRGAAHLSIAFAVGAALPTPLPTPIEVHGQFNEHWADEPLALDGELSVSTKAMNGSGALAAFVDLVPGRAPSRAFDSHLSLNQRRYVSAMTVDWVSDREIAPEVGSSLASHIASLIRDHAGQFGVNRVSLFLRTPSAIAFLMGRLFNTFVVELFEWENEGDSYKPVVRVGSGLGNGPILEILDDE